MVVFDKDTHVYTDSETGKKLISATTLLNKYKPVFNSKEAATRVAAREGLTVDFILNEWEQEKNKACNYGTYIHEVMESFLKNNIKDDNHNLLYESYNNINYIFKKFPALTCEKKISDIQFKIAGTADLIYENNTHFFVGDFKTNKTFKFYNDYNSYYSHPISHLSVCEFNSYALQLSLYALLYEKDSGKKCAGLVIFYLSPEKQWYPIYVNYLKKEIIDIIADYNNPS